ncbi:hypothetical protein COEREDRAFT_84537 [Coemansia reversa NRRL 1564]|uniref:Uncharacterized protein n=1 Tax=Coemansia reversa (strain ATCC 12441 / NRRL 1564) TaxID=763665 RepID=A0A2G5BJN8_COERN|nr:hypothetical protein COEREDRAFT_84537 [Coemansia reversa NRRL 1564]|eukprot:PIA19230.1 hypothetical protein COEREDRAFT_84537 [Coemansia reversa NRRL 1564]
MSAAKQPEGDSVDNATTAQCVVITSKDATHERSADHILWLLNNLHVPLTLAEMENPLYDIIEIMTHSDANSHSSVGVAAASCATGAAGVGHQDTSTQDYRRSLTCDTKHQESTSPDFPARGIAQLAESLDHKYKLTEDTVFWRLNSEYNVVFVLDISQSMYSLDPNTNNLHIQTALETLEKCLMGMVQPFTVKSMPGLPPHEVEPHICVSVVAYCPRQPGSYSNERGHEKLPFCRTLAHAHMVTAEELPEFMKTIRNFLFNYECEIQDSLGSFPPPPPRISLDSIVEPDVLHMNEDPSHIRQSRGGYGAMPFESASRSSKRPQSGDTFSFSYDPDAPLLHTLQIADYFLKLMPEVCSAAFVYLTDGVMRSNFSISKAQSVTSSLSRRSTQCTFIQVGSCGGFTPETTLGFVGDNELLFYLAASLDGHFIYASDCPDVVLPRQINFYHRVMLIKETRLARTPIRHRYDSTLCGLRRPVDMPRERLDSKKDSSIYSLASRDIGFPWCAECKPPVVDTVIARYRDYNIPVNLGALIELRMDEGFTIRTIQVRKLDPEGLSERVIIKMELVWHPNITIIYRIINTHYAGHGVSRNRKTSRDKGKASGSHSPSDTGPDSVSPDDHQPLIKDRWQRGSNMVDIVIRAYKMFTSAFLRFGQGDERKNELFNKAELLQAYLKAIVEKDEQLRQVYILSLNTMRIRNRHPPPVFVPPITKLAPVPPNPGFKTVPLGVRVLVEAVDPGVFLKHSNWNPDHYHMYDMIQQQPRASSMFASLANFRHTASMYIEPAVILSWIDSMDFTETAKYGHKIFDDFRAYVCHSGTWALLREEGMSVVFLRDDFRQSLNVPVFIVAHWQMVTNWVLRVTFSLFNGTSDARKIVLDCLPEACQSFRPDPDEPDREYISRTARPLHLLPVDMDITEPVAPNLLSTRNIGDLHTYVLEWRWTYLAREGTRNDLSGEGSDREIVQQALHRLALTLGFHRITQDFTLLNAKGESTGLVDSPGASDYDSCISFYHEREGLDSEDLPLSCQYQIVVDMKQSSVTARTWVEPWSPRFIRSLFENDFRHLAPLATFQQILQPERCFQLKVPNLAEFQSKRMNMFSIIAVVNSSRLALRVLQMPEISPATAIWNLADGDDDIKIDDPTFEITLEPDPDEDIEVSELDENGNVTRRMNGAEYFKTHDRDEATKLANANKLRLRHMGTRNGHRQAILLERFMLTVFGKNDEGKYDPHIEKYRLYEYNPFILALINPGHPRKLFFNNLTIKWLTTGDFTTVAHRCFMEFALFKHCNAISISAEQFKNLRFASSIVHELTVQSSGLKQTVGVPNELDDHLYLDKWFVIRLANNSSFLMVLLPNMPLAAPKRQGGVVLERKTPDQTSTETEDECDTVLAEAEERDQHTSSVSSSSLPSSPLPEEANHEQRMAINGYTLAIECSMDISEMRRHVRAMDSRMHMGPKTTFNLRRMDLQSEETHVEGDALQGFVGQEEVPTPFTEYALAEIKRLERMYSEAHLQTIYLALLLKRQVAKDDLLACLQSTLWTRQSIDVDITAFLHSQDVARLSRDDEWQAQDRENLQDKFAALLGQSFRPLAHDKALQGRYYYCRTTRDKRSELELCLQLAQNPLFINLQCSVEVLGGEQEHTRQLNMPIDMLPLSLERLCEQTKMAWRPPTDHFEPLSNVRVILHLNCLYLPEELQKGDAAGSAAAAAAAAAAAVLQPKPDREELESRAARLFQKTMSLSSLASSAFDSAARGMARGDSQRLPSAVLAKQHTNAQMATLEGLPHDQLELVRHCHRRFVRFIAQETLYALRDIRPATAPLLDQVWHTIATTVDDEVPADRFEFSHNKIEMHFVISTPDESRRHHALQLVMQELLRQDGLHAAYSLGSLQELANIVYMRDVRSRSARQQAGVRIRARAMSDAHEDTAPNRAVEADLSDATPAWFLIKPTALLDGVRILTHNYSIVSDAAADNVLAATRQLLMVALKAANTRLLLEEMAESHKFPDQLMVPEAARKNVASSRFAGSSETLPAREDLSKSVSRLPRTVRREPFANIYAASTATVSSVSASGISVSSATTPAATTQSLGGNDSRHHMQGDPYDIASVLKPYIPDSPEFYSCEEQFQSTFPLHPRISTANAIQAVLSTGMMNNRLVNHRNMFFVRDGGSIFYALLTSDRMPYVNPFGNCASAVNNYHSSDRHSASVISAPTPVVGKPSPLFASALPMHGAHTIATTSPDPSAFLQRAETPNLSPMDATGNSGLAADVLQTSRLSRRPSLMSATGLTSATQHELSAAARVVSLAAADSSHSSLSNVPGEAPVYSHSSRAEMIFNGALANAAAESATRVPTLTAQPASPLDRHPVSSLTRLEGERLGGHGVAHTFVGNDKSALPRWGIHGSEPSSPVVSHVGHVAIDSSAVANYRLPHTVSITSMPVFDNHTLSDAISAVHAEEKDVPCIVLRVYGVDKPRKEMTQGLVQQIRELITVNVTMPEISSMLLRRVALNDHDMSFLFPECDPEPTILYLPMPRFVHNLDRLLQHMRQAFGEIVPLFPASDLLAKAIRRTFAHIRKSHEQDGEEKDDRVIIGDRVPNSLRGDLARLLEGWEYDRQTSRRVPVEKLTFLYNFFTKSGLPPREMADIGVGIGIIAALPLSAERVISKGIWEMAPSNIEATPASQLNAAAAGLASRSDMLTSNFDDALMISTSAARRASLAPYQRHVGSFSNASAAAAAAGTGAGASSEQASAINHSHDGSISPPHRREYLMQRRTSYTPLSDRVQQLSSPSTATTSPVAPVFGEGLSFATNNSPAAAHGSADAFAASRPLPASETAALFNEYLRQFKEARGNLRLEHSDYDNLPELMHNQVEEFAGKPVLAITLWSNANLRMDRLLAYVSQVYWNALGDYVSEQVLYPILSSGWGLSPDPEIRLPDPYKELDSCIDYPTMSKDRSRPKDVVVKLNAQPESAGGGSVHHHQTHRGLLRTRAIQLPKAPSTFTENSKKQVHAMEIARQMARYWGLEKTVESLRYHRQKLPRVTGISHWFSEELRGVLESTCPSMHPALFRLLENPLVLDENEHQTGSAPKSLFPAFTLRKSTQRDSNGIVYDVSSLPKALKGTRQSFCIMCTLPLDDTLSETQLQSQQQQSQSQSQHRFGQSSSSLRIERTSPTTTNAPAFSVGTQNRRVESLMKRPGESGYQRPSARPTTGSITGPTQARLHGLGLQGWNPSDIHARHRYNSQRYAPRTSGDRLQITSRPRRLPLISEHSSSAAKKQPSPSDYKPVADPETLVLGAEEITHYSLQRKTAQGSTIAWIIVWLVGGELEMVGYNIAQRLWDSVCDQIKQRLERESRRKQLLGMFASHMCGIFPGYDRKAQHKGITSTWLDRDVTRDLINKYAPLKQLISDDQIHYFNIERQISPDYMLQLGLYEGSEGLTRLVNNPPVTGMTLNDSKTELVLRQLQPEHLRWARKLTFADYTQPYVDTQHPDTLFRIGSRLMRAYQGRITQVLRYDELMRIAERWCQLAAFNGMGSQANNVPRTLVTNSYASDMHMSSSEDHRLYSRSLSTQATGFSSMSLGVADNTKTGLAATVSTASPIQAPYRGDQDSTASSRYLQRVRTRSKGKEPDYAGRSLPKIESSTTASSGNIGGVSLEDIRKIMENARLLHFVCAPLPLSTAIKPMGTDQRAFDRLFRAISAMLQNLADSYIDYLCSVGYIVARRYERARPWKEALAGLGYSADSIELFTDSVIGELQHNLYTHSAHSGAAQATLPSIQVPGAYLFANTERSNLVTDVEVSPEMLSIRMHAMNRFTSEWRSTVPGYVRSAVIPRSIKKFTSELAKFKKLLHVKSFVYDFQLRYVACVLKRIRPNPSRFSSGGGGAGIDSDLRDLQEQYVIYSSDSELDDAGDSSSSDETSSSEADGGGLFAEAVSPAGTAEGRRIRRLRKRTIAQALCVHIDLTIFLRALSQQRYYSTRFSSRRLVRTQFSMMHREIYEYFLDHSERYHFYTEGCRPPPSCKEEQYGQGRKIPVPDLCSIKALHSGCYRLYEGALPDSMHPRHNDDDGAAFLRPLSDSNAYGWPPQPPPSQSGERFPLHLSEAYGTSSRPISIRNSVQRIPGSAAASSAPEPVWKMPQQRSAAEDSSHGRAQAYPFPGSGHDGSGNPNLRANSGGYSGVSVASRRMRADAGKQASSSYAPGPQWSDPSGEGKSGAGFIKGAGQRVPSTGRGYGAAPLTAGQYVSVLASERPGVPPLVPSPLGVGGGATSYGGQGWQQRRGEDGGRRDSSTARMLDFAVSEYSACKIYLQSNDTSVHVSLMAMAPDCDVCRVESSAEALRRRERLHSHDQQPRYGQPGNAAENLHKHRRPHRRHKRVEGFEDERRRSHRHARAIDDMGILFGTQKARNVHGQGRSHHPYHATMDSGTGISGRMEHRRSHGQTRNERGWHDAGAPLRRWMASLESGVIADPQADGLEPGAAGQAVAMGQISYYLIIDMDPQTTVGLNSLKTDDQHSRNGSLGLGDSDGHDDSAKTTGTRQCAGCSAFAQTGGHCGVHRALRAAQVDMRDWESKGEVWAAEPTMLIDTSTIDPDAYDREDADVLRWIKHTAKRIISHTAVDYHRDFNWYRISQHLQMANLPVGLAPRDVAAIFAFVERQSCIDVGDADQRVQRLLRLEIPALRIIESLQLRLRHLCSEPTLLMTTLQSSPRPGSSSSSRSSSSGSQRIGSAVSRPAVSTSSIHATPPATPIADTSFGLSRQSTIDQTTGAAAARERMPSEDMLQVSIGSHPRLGSVGTHALPRHPPCPVATVDVHGRVIRERSSANIDAVLRLLAPLNSRLSRRALLDPAFQKILSRYLRLDIADSPWLCSLHRFPISVPACNWLFEDLSIQSEIPLPGSTEDSRQIGISRRDAAASAAMGQSVNRRVLQVQGTPTYSASSTSSLRNRDLRGRPGASIASMGVDSVYSSHQQHVAGPAISIPEASARPSLPGGATHRSSTRPSELRWDTSIGEQSTGSLRDFTDGFDRPLVECKPGTLLVIDPDNSQLVARLLVLNPFAHHSFLELLFERSENGNVRLSRMRAVSRSRRRDGLYEYERKHINMVLSTISAVVWDVMTQFDE